MNVFKRLYKKIFGEKQQVEEKKQECWYNNAHEDASSKLGTPLENSAGQDPNHIDFNATQKMTSSNF